MIWLVGFLSLVALANPSNLTADDLMTESDQLHIQRLEEKLLWAETSLREKDEEIKALQTEAQKSWTLAKHMMKVVDKSKELVKASDELVRTQAAKLKQVKKKVVDYKENIATLVALLVTRSSKAENISACTMPADEGNWEVLGKYQEVLENQSTCLDLLSTMASYGLTRNNSLRYIEDKHGHLVSATLCQCLPNPPESAESREVNLSLVKEGNRWSSHWSAWQFDNCFVNGTSIEHGNLGGGRKTRRRVKDLNMEIWREEVEEIACKSNGCSTYKELNSTTRKFTNVKHGGHCDRRLQRDWQGSGWYRITGEAGTKLIDSPVVNYHCGTSATGWLAGGHPTVEEGEVDRSVNFNYDGDFAKWSARVKVLNCSSHYVYYLQDTPECNLGYCTE